MTFFPNKLYSNSIHVEHENYCEKKKKKRFLVVELVRAHLLLCIYTQQKKKIRKKYLSQEA